MGIRLILLPFGVGDYSIRVAGLGECLGILRDIARPALLHEL